ncbi:MAG: recombinase family protein [Lachnospiraceae bacterium]|jgi:site-specific DNA recombinase|nr:recombinase family protein [Lachnospiraceae bacterium]
MEYLALYLRLSLEDEGDKAESNSIGNQRKQILEYIQCDPELGNYDRKEFCDDGYSGTNMDRPGMQALLKEVRENRITCIIVKDMSRFSRDYIEMGTYLNQIFPFIGVRFIALNDHYDSKEHFGNTVGLDTAFQTLLNDLYSKDISIKVKASFESKCNNGEYVFGQVPTATQFRRPGQESKDGRVHTWSGKAVRTILNNRFYLGEMAYGKTVRKAVGSKNGTAVPKENWKVIPHHHEPLISEELYQQVSSFRPEYSTKRKREKHPLTGKIYCGGCGYSLNYKPLRGKNRHRRFECRKHALLQIPECCTYINADLLEETVLFMLNKELMLRGNAVKEKETLFSFRKSGIRLLKKKLEENRQELKKLQTEKDTLYEEYTSGTLPAAAYRRKADELTEQMKFLSADRKREAERLACLEEEFQKTEEDMKQIIRYSHIEELNQEVVDIFLKKVYAYKDKRIEIEWNFRR